jgi:hypothetical protein
MISVIERQQQRLRFLLTTYEMTDGDVYERINYREVASALGLAEDEAFKALQYLVGERFMKHASFGGGISIEHRGVKEAEAILLQRRPTRHFAASVINIINVSGSSVVGNIQQGTTASEQHGGDS